MTRRGALWVASAATAFLLVLGGGVASRWLMAPGEVAPPDAAPEAAVASPAPAPASVSAPAAVSAADGLEQAYRARIVDANARLARQQEEIRRLREEAATPVRGEDGRDEHDEHDDDDDEHRRGGRHDGEHHDEREERWARVWHGED